MDPNDHTKEQTSLIQQETNNDLKKAEEGEMHKDTSGSPLVEADDHHHDDEEEGGGICSQIVKSKSGRFGCMLTLIIGYFLAEVIVGKRLKLLCLIVLHHNFPFYMSLYW